MKKPPSGHVRSGYAKTPLGWVRVVHDPKGIRAVDFVSRVPAGAARDARTESVARELAQYFAGTRKNFSAPVSPAAGTEFQRKVWKLLSRIPHGETVSYKELARRAGKPRAIRAAAGACARNPLAILVPCHRVIGSDGKLTGYAFGLRRKRRLLALERAKAAA